ncbi:MAG: hypothetical protein ABIH40_05595 [Candidatus Omnitrophota bacterium]
MPVMVKLIGLIIVGMGAIVLLNPATMRWLIAFWKEEKRLYAAGLLRLLLGIILLLAAPQCKQTAVVTVLGILILIGGILIFLLGLEKTKSILEWWNKKPPAALRLMGLVTLAIGLLLFYSV